MHNGKSEKPGKHSDKIPQAVENLLKQVGRRKAALGHAVGETSDVLAEKFSRIKEKASELGWDEVAKEVQTYVKKNPWKGVGIAVGIGFLAGYLLAPSQAKETK